MAILSNGSALNSALHAAWPVIGWKLATPSASIASVRYRALLPIVALRESGFEARVFFQADLARLRELDALVIVKSFTPDDLLLAQEATKANIPVIFDLCDNIFAATYSRKEKYLPSAMFAAIGDYLSAVVVPTTTLAEQVKARVGEGVAVHVIPDGSELPENVRAGIGILRTAHKSDVKTNFLRFVRKVHHRLSYVRAASLQQSAHLVAIKLKQYRDALRRRVERGRRLLSEKSLASAPNKVPRCPDTNRRQILWFGNHGADHAAFGMGDLLLVRAELEQIAAEFPVELVVVSNSRSKYSQLVEPMKIRSRYVEWSPAAIDQELGRADVAVLPNNLDDFSRCKSANRAVLALSHGIPVVATNTEALAPLRDCTEHGDFYDGLKRYLASESLRSEHVALAQQLIERNFSPAAIAAQWEQLFGLLPRRVATAGRNAEFIVGLNLPQDVELGMPMLQEAHRRGIAAEACCSVALAKDAPGALAKIRDLGIGVRIVPNDFQDVRWTDQPSAVRAVLGITESNLAPHAFTRQLIERANVAGIPTATVQHGFENIGLTYSDSLHDIRRISFRSRRIYIWGPVETLHPRIRRSTLEKCRPVGCPKPPRDPSPPPGIPLPGPGPYVGIFENLHWHRYSESYREAFLRSVRQLARALPEAFLVIKPHGSGRWLTDRYEGEPLELENVLVLDPRDSRGQPISATQLMARLSCVITTPSTVALDAARLGIPTAVISQTMDLSNYSPLPLLQKEEHWIEFVQASLSKEGGTALVQKAVQFVRRNVVDGDAARRIVDDLLGVEERVLAR